MWGKFNKYVMVSCCKWSALLKIPHFISTYHSVFAKPQVVAGSVLRVLLGHWTSFICIEAIETTTDNYKKQVK